MATFIVLTLFAVVGQELVSSQVPPSRVSNNGLNRNVYGTKLLYPDQETQISVLQRTPRQLRNENPRQQQIVSTQTIVNGGSGNIRLKGPITVQQRQRVNPRGTSQTTITTGMGLKPRQATFQTKRQQRQVSAKQTTNQKRKYQGLQQTRQYSYQSNRQRQSQTQRPQRTRQVQLKQRQQRLFETSVGTDNQILRERAASPAMVKQTRQPTLTRPREMNNPVPNNVIPNRLGTANPRIIIRTGNNMRDQSNTKMISSNTVSANTRKVSVKEATPSRPGILQRQKDVRVSPAVNRAEDSVQNQAVNTFLTSFKSVLTNAVKDENAKMIHDSPAGINHNNARSLSQTVDVQQNQRAPAGVPRSSSSSRIRQRHFDTNRGNSQVVDGNESRNRGTVVLNKMHKQAVNQGPIQNHVPEAQQVQSIYDQTGSFHLGHSGINRNKVSGHSSVNTRQFQNHQSDTIKQAHTLNRAATQTRYQTQQLDALSPNSRSPAVAAQNDAMSSNTYHSQLEPLQASDNAPTFQIQQGKKLANQQSSSVSLTNYHPSKGSLNPVNVDPYQNNVAGFSQTSASGTPRHSTSANVQNLGNSAEPYFDHETHSNFANEAHYQNYQNRQSSVVTKPNTQPSVADVPGLGVNADMYQNQQPSLLNEGRYQNQLPDISIVNQKLSLASAPVPIVSVDSFPHQQESPRDGAFVTQTKTRNQGALQHKQSSPVTQENYKPAVAGSPNRVNTEPFQTQQIGPTLNFVSNNQARTGNQGPYQKKKEDFVSHSYNKQSTGGTSSAVVNVDQNMNQHSSPQIEASSTQMITETQRSHQNQQSTSESQAYYQPSSGSVNQAIAGRHQTQQVQPSLNSASNAHSQTENQGPIQNQQPSPVNFQPSTAANPVVNVDPYQHSGSSQSVVLGTQQNPGNSKQSLSPQSNHQPIAAPSGVQSGHNTAPNPADANPQTPFVTIGTGNQNSNDVAIGQQPASGHIQHTNNNEHAFAPAYGSQMQHGNPQYTIQYTGMPRHLQPAYGYNPPYPYQASHMNSRGYDGYNHGYGGPYGGMRQNPNYLDPYNPPAPIGSKEFIAWLTKLDQMGIDTPYELPDSTDPPPPPTTTPAPTPPPTTTTVAPTTPTLATAAPGPAPTTTTRVVAYYPAAPPQHAPTPTGNLAPEDLTMTVLSKLQAGVNLEAALQTVLDTIKAQRKATTTTSTTTTTTPPTTTSGFEHFPAHARSVLTGLGLTSESVKHILPGSSLHNTLLSLIDTYVASKYTNPAALSHHPTEPSTTTTFTTTLAPYVETTTRKMDQINYVAETNYHPGQEQPHPSIPKTNAILVQATGLKNTDPRSPYPSKELATRNQVPQAHNQELNSITFEALPTSTTPLSHPTSNQISPSMNSPVESTNAKIASPANVVDGTAYLNPQAKPSVDGMLMNAIERTMSSQGSGVSESQLLTDAFNTAVQHVKAIGIPVNFVQDTGIPLETHVASSAKTNLNNPLIAPNAYPGDRLGDTFIQAYPDLNPVQNHPTNPSFHIDGTPGYPGTGSTGLDVHSATSPGMTIIEHQPGVLVAPGQQNPPEYIDTQASSQLPVSSMGSPVPAQELVQIVAGATKNAAAHPSSLSESSVEGVSPAHQPNDVQAVQQPNIVNSIPGDAYAAFAQDTSQTGLPPQQAEVLSDNTAGGATSNVIVASVDPTSAASATFGGSTVPVQESMKDSIPPVIHFDVAGTKHQSLMDPFPTPGQVKDSIGGNIEKELWRI